LLKGSAATLFVHHWPKPVRPRRASIARAGAAAIAEPPPPSGSDEEADEDLELLVLDAEAGDAEAQYILGAALRDDDKSGDGEHRWAAHWLSKAAEQGDARAQLDMGLLALNGQGMPRDPQAAAAWVSAAANQGLPAAQHQMGLLLLSGTGVPTNPQWARYWFEQAAEKDDPCAADASFRLGAIYQAGLGVNASREMALDWYERAAEKGNQEALIAWQAICRKGPGPAAPGNTPGLPAKIRKQLWGRSW